MSNRCASQDLDHPDTIPFLERARTHTQATLDGLFERLKDAFLDAGGDDDDDFEDEGPPATPLPPLAPSDFILILRPTVEDVLRNVAEAVNAVPDVRSAGLCEERVAELLAEFVGAAVEAGMRLRIEAAEAGGPFPRPQGAWARKYREMQTDEGHWPPLA